MNRYVKVEDIMGYINTDNRGSCDYFIVDKIEELCNSNKIVDLAEHDKQIRDEVIEEMITNALDCDNCYVSIYQLKEIGRKMKGEQNE